MCGHMKENTLSGGTCLKRQFSIHFDKERTWGRKENGIKILDPFLVFLISFFFPPYVENKPMFCLPHHCSMSDSLLCVADLKV